VSKAQYRHSLRCHQQQGQSIISNELHDLLLQKDQNNFWKSWSSKFKRGKSRCPNVGGFTNDFDIANAFVNNFASVCSHNSPSQHVNLQQEFYDSFSRYLDSSPDSECLIDGSMVETAIHKLKTGKAPGVDGITAEHVLNSNPLISLHLLALFNAIIKHSYVPAEFGFGLTIPLLKDVTFDGSSLDNYRAITISPTISKIFEQCLLLLFNCYFSTSELQCGFKAKVGVMKLWLCSVILLSILPVMALP